MKRTVRDVSGAWLLLKNAPVRARATATSFASSIMEKLPIAKLGAFGFRKTPKTFPCRSTTAMTIVSAKAAASATHQQHCQRSCQPEHESDAQHEDFLPSVERAMRSHRLTHGSKLL